MHGLCAKPYCKGLHIYYFTWFSPISPAGIMTPFWTGTWSSRGFHLHLRSLTNKWQSKRLTFYALSMTPSSLATHWWVNVMLSQDSWNLPPGPKKEVGFQCGKQPELKMEEWGKGMVPGIAWHSKELLFTKATIQNCDYARNNSASLLTLLQLVHIGSTHILSSGLVSK